MKYFTKFLIDEFISSHFGKKLFVDPVLFNFKSLINLKRRISLNSLYRRFILASLKILVF